MWTMARLLSAVLFCALGYYSGTLVVATFGEEVSATYFPATIAGIAIWQGWSVLGKRVGLGFFASSGIGFRTSLQIALFGLVLFALREMFDRATRLRYNDFGVALMDAGNLFLEYGAQFTRIPEAWMTLLLGGVVIGLLAEGAKKVWR